MRTAITRTLFAMLGVLMALSGAARAQEISGFSTMEIVYVCQFPQGCFRDMAQKWALNAEAYIDTEEDYTASLYYDVSSVSAAYYAADSTPLISGSITGNPSAKTNYIVPNPNLTGTVTTTHYGLHGLNTYIDSLTPGIYTEATYHEVDFFYVTSVGEYYDPYGYSVLNGQPEGDYNSGYWFSVTVYGTYLAEASAILGESYDSTDNNSNAAVQGPAITTASYQAFIPTDWVPGPGIPSCFNDIYAGDNRGFNSAITSYRAMQSIQMGIGGLTSVTSQNAPPVEATGYSNEFSVKVLNSNNVIPNQVYNFDYLGQCSSLGLNAYGHASTSNMLPPVAVYNGTNSTSTEFCCSAGNPVPLLSFDIDWDVPLTLTEPSASDLRVTGTLTIDCFPAHEVSVAGYDVATFMPTDFSLSHISACLGGVGKIINQPIQYDITLTLP